MHFIYVYAYLFIINIMYMNHFWHLTFSNHVQFERRRSRRY